MGERGGVRGASRNFLQSVAAAASSFPSLGPFAPRWLLPASCRLSGQNRGTLGVAVMPGVWEVTLGEEGAGTRQEVRLKAPKGPARPWEVGALEPGGLGPVGHPAEKRPRPAPKSTPSRPDLCNRDPSGPYISRPLKDQRSFPAVSYKRRGDPGALEAAVAHFRLKRA